MDKNKFLEYLRTALDKYKYVLITCLVGMALVCFPSFESGEGASKAETPENADVAALEQKLESILAEVSGVGRVKVVLTAKSSSQAVYAFNENKKISDSESGRSADSSASLVSVGSSGNQTPVKIRIDEPEYRGAFIVCDGGDSSKVRLEVAQAVSSLTGVSYDNIVISKMK